MSNMHETVQITTVTIAVVVVIVSFIFGFVKACEVSTLNNICFNHPEVCEVVVKEIREK